MNAVHLIDCIDFMADKPGRYYDLAICDPPYFAGPNEGSKYYKGKNNLAICKKYAEIKSWAIPNKEYFNELSRISKDQIIWGVNYYNYHFPAGRIVWTKMKKAGPFSQCEIASNSLVNKTSLFEYLWSGFWQEDMKNKEERIHPTQKPIALYKWLLKNYAKPSQTIFDSHVGSGSIRIACHDLGFDFEGCEIDPDYWQAQEDRYNNYILQGGLFEKEEMQELVYKE